MNGRRGEERLAVLIERSAELKRDLVDFACSPRLERSTLLDVLRERLGWTGTKKGCDQGQCGPLVERALAS